MPIHGYPGNVITANPVAPTSTVATGVWTTEQQLINQSAGRWPMAATQISRSLRFNSADTAYLSRTNTNSPTSTTKFTYSVWVKRGALSIEQLLLMPDRISASSSVWDYFGFDAGDTLTYIYDGSLSFTTTAVFRDVSAWYHIVLQYDSTLSATKCWVNNALLNTGSLTLNRATTVNGTARPQNIGRYNNQSGSPEDYFNGYMTEINMIDGLALDPSYFGFNNSDTGVWSPKQYTGTYGTNGFYLNFSDNSNTTAATLGKDYSGNGNNWTPNNFSVTAGAGNDSLVDSPTSYGTDTGVGGEVRGNYCTLNSVNATSAAGTSLSNGNLQINGIGSGNINAWIGTLGVSSGKWYYEVIMGENNGVVGISQTGNPNTYPGGDATSYGYSSSTKYNNNTSASYGASLTAGDVVGCAYDLDAGTITFYKNGVSQGQAYSGLSGNYFPAVRAGTTGAAVSVNFGQRAFAYTAPSGFKALCTQNLPPVTIGATSTTQANDYFNAVLYTGNGTSQTITGVGFQPDFVWAKGRSFADFHVLEDVIRGATKSLSSDTTTAEVTRSTALTAFTSDGFSVGSDTLLNYNAQTFVAWNWKANGAGSSNTAGTITSTVSASTTAGFSVVTYTGNGSASQTIGHGLGVSPSMVIVKKRTGNTAGWIVHHSAFASTANDYLELQTTGAVATASNWFSKSSTTFGFPTAYDGTNTNTHTYVAYAFAPVAGYSAFGSYTGNGSADGPFVYLGFRPRFVMFKNISSISSWLIIDTQRSPYNQAVAGLLPNSTNAETGAGTGAYDFLSNGFKPRNVATNETNVNGNIYIYAAFAEFPFKFSLAR